MHSPSIPPDPSATACTVFHVLLVEDDREQHDLLCGGLREEGVALSAASDGPEALRAVAGRKYDLILLDIGLPEMDGFEVLRRLKADPATERIPVIVLTAWNDTKDKLRGLDLGAVDYVTKPFNLAELRARMHATLRAKRLQDELGESNRQLEAARVAAEESARAKSEFLANMSHEIRTPMNGVIAMTDLLGQTELTAEQRDFVETIRTSGESLLTIINDILNFSKIESGKMELETRPFDLPLCVEEALDLLAARAGEKKLDLLFQIDETAPAQIVGDVTRLRQILVNLVGNAIKFTAVGEVFVQVKARDVTADADPANPVPEGAQCWELHFSVRDSGIGIRPEKLHRLFQSFSQVDSSTTREYGGTGLGLAISKGLVELMGGRMWVESKPGQGSTFHFIFPTHSVPHRHTSFFVRPNPRLANLRTLLVDDNATSRRLLAEQCERWGLKPFTTESAEAARRRVAQGEGFDLAIIDTQMPDQDGAALAVELRKAPGLSALPLVLLTPVGARAEFPGLDPATFAMTSKPVKSAALHAALVQAISGARPAAKKVATGNKMDPTLASRVPLRILLTDDNIINQKVASRLLQQMGYRADVANNGLEAIRAVERQPYDIILMDVQMPEMDGLEATRRIRARQQEAVPHPHFQQPIKIIAMTANAMQGDREKCVAAGMDDYIPKPVRPETLQDMVMRFGATVEKFTPSPAVEPASFSPPPPETKELARPPQAPAVAEEPPVDMDRLLDFAGGDNTNLNELVALYLTQTTEQIEQIRVAVAAGAAEQISRTAHSCAGASATCGMVTMYRLLKKLEHAATDAPATAWNEQFSIVQKEFFRTRQFLQNQPAISLSQP